MVGHVAGALACLACVAACAASAGADTTVALVPSHSHASFTVRHLYVERVTGTVPIVRGNLTFAPGSALPSHVDAVLDPTHIDTNDRDRDEDLQGPDWFDVKRFPTWTFVSTSVAASPAGFEMRGSLTVHGVAQTVTLDVTTVRGLPHPAYRATATIDRHAFGMRVTPLDGTIGNELELALDVGTE